MVDYVGFLLGVEFFLVEDVGFCEVDFGEVFDVFYFSAGQVVVDCEVAG